jgi:sec-independent protein translocase protein TatB
MFNVTGGELVIILIIALVVLGPERLPGAARSVGKVMAQIRELSHGFQKEFKSALDEVTDPMQAMLNPQMTVLDGKPDTTDKPQSATMAAVGPVVPQDEPDPVSGWSTPPRPVLPEATPSAADPADPAELVVPRAGPVGSQADVAGPPVVESVVVEDGPAAR